jgi:hypothetical protein
MKSLVNPVRTLVVAGAFAFALPSYALTVTSPAFSNGGEMADQFTYTLANQCSGNNICFVSRIYGEAPARAICQVHDITQFL